VYGIGYEDTDYGLGTYRNAVHYPLAGYHSVAEIEANYRWPSADWYDYSVLPSRSRARTTA